MKEGSRVRWGTLTSALSHARLSVLRKRQVLGACGRERNTAVVTGASNWTAAIIRWNASPPRLSRCRMTRSSLFIAFLWLVGAAGALAEENIGAAVQLPYVFHDDMGSNWDVQYDGSIGDGGNDLYDGGGRLFINGSAQYQSPNQQA